MDNYHYIIASLPSLADRKAASGAAAGGIIDEILSQCSARDREVIDFLCSSFDGNNLDADFYTKALSHGNRFIREYFSFDLDVRNIKVEYLNRALSRPLGTDNIIFPDREECQQKQQVEEILATNDILARERGLDDLMWEKIDSLTTFDWFDLEAVLGFIAKLHIIDRWNMLDEQTGREMFRKLVDEVRGTFKGIDS